MHLKVSLLLPGFLFPLLTVSSFAQANLLVGPTSLDFVIAEGSTQPLPQPVFVAANRTGFNFEARAAAPWLFLGQTWGSGPTSLTVSVDAAGLPNGTYHDFISINSVGATPALVSVTFRVGGRPVDSPRRIFSPPIARALRAFPAGLTFIANSATTAPPQSLFVPKSDGEDGVLAAPSAAWLTVSPAKAAGSSAFQQLQVSVNPDGLAPGQYTASVVLRTPRGGERTIPVTFDVGDAAHLMAEPSVLEFRAQPGGSAPSIQTLTIHSTSSNLTYTASTDSGSWLAVGPQTGLTDGLNTIQIAVNPANLPIGVTSGTISIAAPGAMEPLIIPVALTITPEADGISVGGQNNISVTLNGTLGGPKQTMSFQLTSNISGETFAVQPGNTNWLTVDPLSSTVPAVITLTADPNAAGLGTSTAQPFIAGGAGGDTVNFFVKFIVAAGNASTIGASPSSLTFAYTVGGSVPAAQTVQLTSSTMNAFTAQTDASFVNVTPASGSTGPSPTALTVSITPKGLGAGRYTGNVLVSGGLSSGSNILTIPVTIIVTGNTPTCATSVSQVVFNSFSGQGAPSPQTVQLTCTMATSFTAVTGQSFDTVSPASGTVAAGSAGTILTIMATPGSLAAGTYSDVVTISPAGAPVLGVTVIYNIVSPTTLVAAPTALSFTQVAGGPAPPMKTAMVSSGTPTSFSASSDVSFITVSPSSGATPATLTISVNAAALAAGVYQGDVTITGQNSTATVSVTVTVTSSGTSGGVTATPASLAFSLIAGTNSRTPRMIALASSPAVTFTAASNEKWLHIIPASGATGTNSLAVSVVTAGLGPGAYMGTITVTPSSGAAVSIPVSLTLLETHLHRPKR